MKRLPLNICCMRAFHALLMFMLLSLQFSAVAASACCGHVAVEQVPQAQHHQPGYLTVVEGACGSADTSSGIALECGTCHANCVVATTSTAATSADRASFQWVEHFAEPVLPPWHEQPYRPQWSALKVRG